MNRIFAQLRRFAGARRLIAIVLTLQAGAQPDMSSGAGSNLQISMTLNWSEEHQVIDGFGAAEGDYYGAYLQNLPEPQRSQMLDLAFSRDRGIGLTILRSGISAGPAPAETMPSLEPSPGVWNYNDPIQVWLMKEAVRRGPVKLIASVWSPPAWMKT